MAISEAFSVFSRNIAMTSLGNKIKITLVAMTSREKSMAILLVTEDAISMRINVYLKSYLPIHHVFRMLENSKFKSKLVKR